MTALASKNWFDRNWKWFVPLLCLLVVLVIAGFVASILYLVFGIMKSGDAYKEAVARVRANPQVVMALGTPIREGLFVSGSVSVSGPSGRAELAIPISGPRGKGTVYVEARKSAGRWDFGKLVVEIESTHQRLDLLPEGKTQEQLPPPPGSDTF